MKRTATGLGLVMAGLGAAVVAAPTMAAPGGRGGVTVTDGWSRATAPRAATGGGYLTLRNTGAEPDRLVGAASPRAARVTLHAMSMAGGVMRMRPLAGGLALPAHGAVRLGANGDHLMLEGLTAPLRIGETIPVTLRFAHAGAVATRLRVVAADAESPYAGGEAKR